MNNKEIHELIKLVDKSDLAEFKMKQGDFSVTIRSKDFFKGKAQQMVSVMPSAAAPAPEAAAAASLSAPETKNIESNTANTDTPPSEDYFVFKSPNSKTNRSMYGVRQTILPEHFDVRGMGAFRVR